MREGKFINHNLPRWESYDYHTDNPDEVAERFTWLVDDLSYAKTFYPNSNTIKFINAKASPIYLSIYENKKDDKNRIVSFVTTELPLIIYKHRRILLFAFLFFLTFCLIGFFSSSQDQTIVRAILGDEYVDMTEQNIANGDPFGVYKNEKELSMFIWIAFNNIRVAFLTFASGIFTPAGTLYFIFKNGVMVGAFSQLFAVHGLSWEFYLVVFIHGTLELSALVIAGTAGIVLGNGFLFPKTYKRIQSLQMAAKDSIKIMIALVPIIVMAAFLEGYITRHTEMPLVLSLFILISSALFIIGYFVIWPFVKFHSLKLNRV